MSEPRDQDAMHAQADSLREFNRYYTTRLGLLRRRYLDSQFSPTEARILYELFTGSGTTAASLRRVLSLDAGYISRLLSSLQTRGLIKRKASVQDRRVSFLKLTSSGRCEAVKPNSGSSSEMEHLLQQLSVSERLALTANLQSVHKILSEAEGGISSRESTVVVRATISQVADVRELLKEYYREINVTQKDASSALRSSLSDSDSGLWIAYVGDVPAGCVMLRPLKDYPLSAECKRLYVRPSFRRRGLAEQLLDAMEGYAKRSALSWIYLDSKKDLIGAIALYRQRGYKPCKRYNQNPQATVFLRKMISVPLATRK